MGMDRMGAPPMGAGMPPAGGPPKQPGGMPGLQELWESLPPEFQSKLDPNDPISQLHFERLRQLPEGQLDALAGALRSAGPAVLSAFKTAFPEIELLFDLLDDGEINNSVGGGAPSAGGPPMAGMNDDYEDEEEDEPRPGGRMAAIMA